MGMGMNWLDWMIVLTLAGAAISGFAQGFFRAASSFAGLFAGLVAAAWYYPAMARLVEPLTHQKALSRAIGFMLTALLVMAAASILGRMLSKGFHWLGIGWLDHLAGGAFGLSQGALLVTLGLILLLAFAPEPFGIRESKYARPFLGLCRGVTHMSPDALAGAIRAGLKKIEESTPNWIHPQV
jgi:membrane protein required for colicin V production